MDGGDYPYQDSIEIAPQEGCYVICTYCKGKGYYEKSQLKKEINFESSQTNGFTLPVIGSPKMGQQYSYTHKQPLKEKFDYKLPSIHPDVSQNIQSNYRGVHRERPPLIRDKSSISETSEIMADLIGHKEIDKPIEYFKVMKAQLKASDWNDRISGIQGAVHLSRIEPDLVIHEGRIISRTILSELGSLRSRCVRISCQACKELFKLGGFVFRPEFDEIVNTLLCRASDSKRTIRDEADEALAIIASYTPVQHIARAITKGTKHKHQLVRKSVLRVYKILVSRLGTTQLMKNTNYNDVRAKVIEAGCIFMDDPISEIRNSSKEMMKPLIKFPEFEVAISQDIGNSKCYQRVETSLLTLKYE